MKANLDKIYSEWHRRYDSKDENDLDLGYKKLELDFPQILVVYNKIEKKSKVIDLGCGDGFLLRLLKEEKNCTVTGVDFSDYRLNIATQRGIKVIKANLEEYDFYDLGQFDYIISTEVIEHLFRPIEYLENCKKLLNINSKIILTTPNLAFIKNRFNLLFGRHPSSGEFNEFHINLMTLQQLRNYLDITGFEIVDIKGSAKFRNEFLKRSCLNRWLNNLASEYPSLFSARLIVEARLK